LGFVLNAIVLWTTIYLDAVLSYIRQSGRPVDESDIAHLLPLGYDHLRIEGCYQFSLAPDLAKGGLRQLRSPRPANIFRTTA